MKTISMLRKCPYGVSLVATVMLIFLQVGCNSVSSSSPVAPRVPLVIISDVHFTPFYDTTIFDDLVNSPVEEWVDIFESSTVTDLSTWGQETNYPLLKKALDAASRNIGKGQAAVFPGDILAHRFPEKFFKLYGEEDQAALRSFVYKTVVFFATQVRARFGNVPVMFTLGNNDSYAGDYQLVPGGAFLADTAEAFFDTFLLGSADRKTYLSTYSAGGYFVAEPPDAKVLFVCVNSILFSEYRTESCADAPLNAPSIQLDWLEKVLAKAHADKKKVFMLTHIPAGMNIYDTVKDYMDESGKISDADLFWKESCRSRFLEICRQYESVIEIIFSGHTHMDEYLLVLDRDGEAYKPAVVTPAVSPQYGNNPAFKVMTLREEDWKPLDYNSISCDLALSSPEFSTYYVFSEAYSMMTPLEESLVDLYPKMRNDADDRRNYGRFYYSGHDDANIIDNINWPAYWCGVGKMDKEKYIECVNGY